MNIKFKDIESIISGLCCANAMLDAKIGVSPTFTTNVTLRLYFHRNIHKLNL